MIRDVTAWLQGLTTRILMLAVRGLVKRTKYDGGVQLLQVGGLAGETMSEVEHLQPFGFSSRARTDTGKAEYFGICVAGDRSRLVVLSVLDRTITLKINEGETAIYDAQGQSVYLHADGAISLKANNEVRINAPTTKMIGAAQSSQLFKGIGGVSDSNPITPTMQSMREAFNIHTHPGGGGPVPQM